MNTVLANAAKAPASRAAHLRLLDDSVSRAGCAAASIARGLRAGAAVLASALLISGCGGSAAVDTVAAADVAGGTGDQHMAALAVTGTTTMPATTGATVWTACANEGQTCAFTGTKQVRYGTASTGVIRTATGGVVCSNAFFGDPLSGATKSCTDADVPSATTFDASTWAMCAGEGGTCIFTGTRLVRYGSITLSVTQALTSRTVCSDAVFGDPAPGVGKACWYSTEAVLPETWNTCARENQTCTFSGTRTVRYGTSTNFRSGIFTNSVACSNAIFGDPAVGSAKSCTYSSLQTAAPANSAQALAPVPILPTPVITPVPDPLVTVALAPATVVTLGTRAQLVASFGASQGSGAAADTTWSVADPTVATLSASGIATPLRAGFTTVTATLRGQSVTSTLSVRGPTPMPTRSAYVGVNLGTVTYYGTNFPFSNLVRDSGGWGSTTADSLTLGVDGYPTSMIPGQHARMAVAWASVGYPSGRYTVLWDGDGTISFPLSDVSISERTLNRLVVVPNTVTGAIWVQIDTTNPANPVRNVRFLLPGTESTYATQPFNPTYLQKIAPFSLLRFMDWGKTNGSSIVEWADRVQPNAVSYGTPKGVPIEVMIDLANTLHVDPWICIPHMASDDYVRQFATLLHARLDPSLKPHIEYSNEMWNNGFSQTQWGKAQSTAAGLLLPWGVPSQFYAKRAVQMSKIMRQVYGADSARLVRVLGGQASWTQFQQNALAYADTAANVDVLAIAPYFDMQTAAIKAMAPADVVALSPDRIIDEMLVQVRGFVKTNMTSNAALAAQYRIKMVGYESGPGDSFFAFQADKQDAMVALYAAANRSPRMKDLYVEYYTQWKAAGGTTMNQFSDVTAWSKWGFWGALESVFQDPATSPKYQGLMTFIAANPR